MLVGESPSPSSALAPDLSLSANCRMLSPSAALPLPTQPSLVVRTGAPPATRFPENAILFSRYRIKLCNRRLDLILKSRPSIVSAVQDVSASRPIPQLLFRQFLCIIILTVILTVIYKIDKKAAFILDSCLLKIPV